MRGNADAVGATSREQLLALSQRRGQAQKTLVLFLPHATTAVRNGSARAASLQSLALLNAAVVRRQVSWTQSLSAERVAKRQRVSDGEKRDVVFFAKMAQSVVKSYVSVNTAEAKEEGAEVDDLVAALDLACVALYVVCVLEHAVRLGDFVVDNLLYQVAKKYAEIPRTWEAATCVAACVHLRLWDVHAKLCGEKNEATATETRFMVLLNSQDEANTKIANTVAQKLEVLAEFPKPRSCHTTQFARLVLGHTNTYISLLAAANNYEGILLVAESTLSSWIGHLQNSSGENEKLASSFSDRTFRILWKYATAMDSSGQKSSETTNTALRFRTTALEFLLKCSNYTSSYFIQQVHRVGVQHERASKRSQLGLQEVYTHYSRLANALTQSIPNSTHVYSSDLLQWEYIQWLEHFALVCDASGMHLRSAMIMNSAIRYVKLFGSMSEPIQLCLLFSIAGALFSATSSAKLEQSSQTRSEPVILLFDRRLEHDSGRVIRELVHSCSSDTWIDQCEKAARVYLIKLEALTTGDFVSMEPKGIVTFAQFLTRCLKRGSTKIFNYTISVQQSAKYQLYHQVVTSFHEMCKLMQKLRASLVIMKHRSTTVEILLLEESRFHRMSVVLLVRRCVEDSSVVAKSVLQEIYRHVQLVRVLLDEATVDGKPSEAILQGILGDLNVIARECYNCAIRSYKAGNFQDTVSALIGAFELAESYLEYVMCSNLSADEVHKVHAELKVDAIVSLLGHCFRKLEDFTKLRTFTGYSILYCGDINERIPRTSVDKFVSCILEEANRLGNQSEVSLIREFEGFVDNATHVFKARYITKHQISMLWNTFRLAFEQFATNTVASMRTRNCIEVESSTVDKQISMRLCCALENYIQGVLMERTNVSADSESLKNILLEVSFCLTKRKQIYYGFYDEQNYNDSIAKLLLVQHSLSSAAHKLQCFSDRAAADLGGVYGWRGVISMEIAIMFRYAGVTQECGNATDTSIDEESVIADIERCLMYWSECGETFGVLFDAHRVVTCLESVCNTLSIISCSAMEKVARKLLKKVQQLSTSCHCRTLSATPPVLLSLLDGNDDNTAMIRDFGVASLSNTDTTEEILQFEQVDEDISAAGISKIDDNAAQSFRHLHCAITKLRDIRTNMTQHPTATVAKALGMRELFVHTILSGLHFREGRCKCAISEAKAALRICWKLVRKFGTTSFAEVGYFELPPEIASTESQQGNSTQVLFFKAFECTSWDLLATAKVLLCRIASLYSLSDQPYRASYYLKAAMRLVGGLNLHLFPRKPFYDFAELELNSNHVHKAKVAISLLTSSAGPNANDACTADAAPKQILTIQSDLVFLEQNCNEIVQRGDVHRSEGEHQVALCCYLEAIEVLSAADQSDKSVSQILTSAKARCWRKYVGLQSQTIDFADSAAVESLLASMKKLKRLINACAVLLERVKCMLELGSVNTKLLRSTSPRAFTSLERTVTLLEEAFLLGDHLGIPHLSQQLRAALGMIYFAEIEENARTEDAGGIDRARFLSWASSSLLANAGTADVVEMELGTADSDSDIATKKALLIELKLLAASPSGSRDQTPQKHLTRMAQTVAEKVRRLPDTWVIVSLMITLHSELVITRIPTNSSAPTSFCLPQVVWVKCMRDMDDIIQESRNILSGHTAEEAGSWSTEKKKEWWSTRKLLDKRIEKTIHCMQETLGFWRCLLVKSMHTQDSQIFQSCWNILVSNKQSSFKLAERNQVLLSAVCDAEQWLSDSEVIDALNHIATEIEVSMTDSTAQKILQMVRSAKQHSAEAIDADMVSNLSKLSTERITKMKVGEVKRLLATEGLSTDGLKKVLVERLVAARDTALFEKLELQAQDGGLGCSTILILNHQLQQFPWEGMDVMSCSSGVTRMPSLDLILQNAGQAPPVTRVGRNRVRFLLNPAGDLKATQSQLGPILEGGTTTFGWEGVVGEAPDPDELRGYLLAADLYIYCGHGSGEAYLHRDKVSSLQSNCSAALLFGCSSGRLEREGIFGPSGAVLSYLRAGSPAVLAMLWDVTDRDIDQLSVKILQEWLLADHEDESESRSLAHVLQDSRAVCKLKYLNGHAAVCYGLPLHVTKG